MTTLSKRLREIVAERKARGSGATTTINPNITEWLDEAADEIERLRALLADKQYIQILADYNKGHLSHANWLEVRERRALEKKP